MSLIEVKAKYISYWKSTVTSVGFLKEVAQATIQGKVADTGVQRHLTEEDIKAARDFTEWYCQSWLMSLSGRTKRWSLLAFNIGTRITPTHTMYLRAPVLRSRMFATHPFSPTWNQSFSLFCKMIRFLKNST